MDKVHTAFTKGKQAVRELMSINDQTMYQTASNLESRAYRAMMPGVIAIASAFIFAMLFSYLVNLFFVSPIIRLTHGIQDYLDSKKPFDVTIETNDEIADLAASVKLLIGRSGT